MDILVLIFGIIGWIYKCRPLLIATLVMSSCGVLLSSFLIEDGAYISILIYIAGIITSLVRMLKKK